MIGHLLIEGAARRKVWGTRLARWVMLAGSFITTWSITKPDSAIETAAGRSTGRLGQQWRARIRICQDLRYDRQHTAHYGH
jgi:hypothetical protein